MRANTAATIGNFDGVHRGHRLLLDFLKHEASVRGLAPIAITFPEHPLSVISPDKAPGCLQVASEKLMMLEALGVKGVMIDFTENLRRLTTKDFMRHLKNVCNVSLLAIGHDNRFGSDAPRDEPHDDFVNRCRAIGAELDMEVVEAPQLPGVNSSAIRRNLEGGNIIDANSMLGRPYSWRGKVVEGMHIGRTIGFPTANMEGGCMLPGAGVYACIARVGADEYPAMVNIGLRPTFDDRRKSTVEAHIAGFSGNLYDLELDLQFLRRLRSERRFNSPKELQRQLARDLKETILVYKNAKG